MKTTDAWGDFVPEDEADGIGESLLLRFSPSSIPLRQRWRNNGLSADFLADYVTTFLPGAGDDPADCERRGAVRGAVSFVANELLENAMKYSDGGQGTPIHIRLVLQRDRLTFWLTNTVSAAQADRFRSFIDWMQSGDSALLFVQQMEVGAAGDGPSGLGFLTMVNDYAARLAWRFDQGTDGLVTIVTQVRLDI